MARIFSIQFTYDGVEHNAMISVRTTPFFTEYKVFMLDETIAGLLPNNKIISTTNNNYVFAGSTSTNDPLLMQQLLKAVSEHLQSQHV